jgi:hypothetical protein
MAQSYETTKAEKQKGGNPPFAINQPKVEYERKKRAF